MEKPSKELMKEFVNSQRFTSTADIMNSMKELFSDILQQVMEAELEEKPDTKKVREWYCKKLKQEKRPSITKKE